MSKRTRQQALREQAGRTRKAQPPPLLHAGRIGCGCGRRPARGGSAGAAETDADKKKARYRETDHVKTFYRVNRY